MVKKRISASVEKETIAKINHILKNGNYRNKSHVIENAIELLKRHEDGQFIEALKELGGFGK